MRRLWWVTVLIVGAALVYFTPNAYAGCEGGATSGGHHYISFCCGGNGGGGGGGQNGQARIIGGLFTK